MWWNRSFVLWMYIPQISNLNYNIQHLVESMPCRIKEVLKAKGAQT